VRVIEDRRRLKTAVLLIVVTAAGCALDSVSKLQGHLRTFQGKPEAALLDRYGEPDEQRDADGQRWLTWSAQERSFHEGYWLGFENESTYVARCRIIAVVRNATVVQVTHEGNIEDCRSLGMI
jgi:hypothetical protein